MKTIKYENLIDVNTGKTVEIEVPDDFDENNPASTLAGDRGREFGARFTLIAHHNRKEKIKTHLREVANLKEVGDLGREAGEKLAKAFGIKNLK